MQSAIQFLGLEHLYPPTHSGSGDYMCPVCGEPAKPRKKKLHIDRNGNWFNCPRCGFKGGPFQFWAYYRNMPTTGPDWAKEVAKDFHSVASGATPETRKRAQIKYVSKETERLDADYVSNVYTAFLKKLKLYPKHLEDLKKRGLTESSIKKGGYRSLPQNGIQGICSELEAGGYKLIGVPGFFKENGRTSFVVYGSGYLIPCIDVQGRVVALQLRLDNANKDKRYFTISSGNEECGTRGAAHPHFSKGTRGGMLIITEGPLKANIISQFTGYSAIGVLGVNNKAQIPEMLETLKKGGEIREVAIAYDMDMLTNQRVLDAREELEKDIIKCGLAYSELTWDPGTPDSDGKFPYKGLDDYLVAKYK